MTNDTLPRAAAAVIHQQLPDGAVLFLPAEEVYFGLNEVGALVWSLLPPRTRNFAELCDAVCAQYPDAARDAVEQDVRELIAELLASGLVTGDHGEAVPPGVPGGAPGS
jgi:hypothetical protein